MLEIWHTTVRPSGQSGALSRGQGVRFDGIQGGVVVIVLKMKLRDIKGLIVHG